MRHPFVPERLRAALAVACLACTAAGSAAARGSGDPGKTFSQTVRPFVNQYCVACHSGKTPAGGLDLKSYTTLDSVIADSGRWVTVANKLAAKQMPPAKMPQPPDAAREQVISWVKNLREMEARKNAGDPGPVLARRLSNAEYNYTIRDLTGVDLQPTKEFPVDPANPAGFDNSGESLSMSPALLAKYLQAARDIANHMVLKPDGSIDFAPWPMLVETDREKYAIQRIVNFYLSRPTDFADYFEAAWKYKYRKQIGKPHATLEQIAADSKISPKYLPFVWQILNDQKDAVGPVAKLQKMWLAVAPPDQTDEEQARQQFVEMRDWVIRIRKDTGMQFAAPKVKGLSATSQPLMNWKLEQYNEHRRDFDPKSLRNDTDPPFVAPPIPKYPGLGREAAYRWAAIVDNSRATDPDLVVPAAQRAAWEAAFAKFASVFPDQFYVKERGRYFPDDSEDKGRLLSAGYHNVMGYWRDDVPLCQLILEDAEKKQLDQLWDEFDFIADYTRRTWVQYYFNQSGEIDGHGRESGSNRPSDAAVQAEAIVRGLEQQYLAKAAADPSNDPVAQTAIRVHFERVNAQMRKVERMHVDAEPRHLDALLKFAARAYRRPLTKAEQDDLIAYYHSLRTKSELTHEEAIRDCIVSVLMSPDFLYRLDLTDASPASGAKVIRASAKVKGAEPLSGYALANRLSYFLWASMPDEDLMSHAASGDLVKRDVLVDQVRRMLNDERLRGMVTEFAGNWLEFRQFQTYNSVDRDRFPAFTNDLREAMFQEPVRFIEDAIRNNRSVLDMLYGDYTFVNPVLAKFYGMPEVKGSPDTWVRVDNANKYGRGGLLPMSVFLTENSPGLRTSPVKRGHWLVKDVLGEVVPPPPPVVPELPSDEAKTDLPIRDLLAQHRANPMCAACHSRFDSLGLALEGYGPVGEARTKDLGGRAVDASAEFPGGIKGTGVPGVQEYIRERRQKDFVDNLCRKLLAYALDRSLMLSDEPLIEKMEARLASRKYEFDSLIETIVTSPQFLDRRLPDHSRNSETRPKMVLKNRKSADNKGV